MADDYTRQGEIFRAKEVSSKKLPVLLLGAHARTYKGVESVDCTGAGVKNLTPASGATHADILMEGATSTDFVRYWHGSSDPTAAVGCKLYDGEILTSAEPSTITFIKGNAGTGGTLRVEYYAWQ